tara:strand:+ start:310 stop:468 length:159 start_codon:yes stop_codon:yes gene_type:complete
MAESLFLVEYKLCKCPTQLWNTIFLVLIQGFVLSANLKKRKDGVKKWLKLYL